MASGATLKGADDVIRELERRLGDSRINRVANKALKETAKEMEPEFKEALSVFRHTGATMESVTVSRVSTTLGVPMVKMGFGKGNPTRWQLVHLNEFGYAKNPHPRGFGVIRRFAEAQKASYKGRIAKHIKIEGLR